MIWSLSIGDHVGRAISESAHSATNPQQLGVRKFGSYHELLDRDAVVRVESEKSGAQGLRLAQFRAEHQARRAQQLQLRLRDAAQAQESVHEVHRQQEHFFLAILLDAHLHRQSLACSNVPTHCCVI